MIDIVTTRFHDAYSYLVSDVNAQSNNNNNLKHTTINRYNEELRKNNHFIKMNGNSVNTTSALPMDGLICQDCTQNSNQVRKLLIKTLNKYEN
jgi:hypothetical protein